MGERGLNIAGQTIGRHTAPRFQYQFAGRTLRKGDQVDGVYRSQFVYDAAVTRPECPEYGYSNDSDYTVEVRVGSLTLLLKRSDISNVRRAYQPGDWV